MGKVAIVCEMLLPEPEANGQTAPPVALQLHVTPVIKTGTLSVNTAPSAGDGPALTTSITYLTVPSAGTEASPDFTTPTSATRTGVPTKVVTVLVLLLRSGSVTPGGGVIVSVLFNGPEAGATPFTVITKLPPDGNCGTVPLMTPAVNEIGIVAQALVPVPLVPVHVTATLLSPAGS